MGKDKLESRQLQKQHLTKIILLGLTAALMSSCAYLNREQGYVDDKPQNRPAGWERNVFGVGF